MKSGERHDAIVIGAGIVGAACARTLSRDGLKVLVLDAAFAGGGTTAAGMGHIVLMDDSPEQLALTAYSAELWRELTPVLPRSVEMDPCGTIWVAEDDAQMDAVREKQRTYAAHDIPSETLSAARLHGLEPNLRSGLAGGLLVRGDAVLYPPAAALWLLEKARENGATIRESCRVDEIINGAVRVGTEVIEADVIVNAAGAEAGTLAPALPIVPRKGHLAISDRAPGFCRHQLVELGYLTSAHVMTNESVAFNVQPRSTGQVLIGSSRELVGWDGATNRRVLARMLERARLFMPGLSHLSIVRTWTGFRPATIDKLPLIGQYAANQWVAAGHEGLGITTSLGSAEILADLVAGRTPAIHAMPFSPMRSAVAAA
ncbi:MAG: dependent oxidoreductase [Gemmatimonadetes bacterium]|nr:dependent oxidoreductase [Gemmatimonadota bacterium]